MLYVRKKRDYFTMGTKTNDEETMEKQAILFPARDKKTKQVGNVFELCNTEKQTNCTMLYLLTNGQF